MHAILGLSPLQLLSLWSELEQAYYGDNSFGGDTAEIYAFRLLENSPVPLNEQSSHAVALNLRAARALSYLCGLFEGERACRVLVDGVTPGDWILRHETGLDRFNHRAHVQVVSARTAA